MKQLIVCLLLIFTANTVFSQEEQPARFPESFIGQWKGTLEWYPLGAREARKVEMELRIQASPDSAGQYTWNIIYGTPTADNRPYILKPVDTATGHWIIDEMNGIVLDQYWIGNKFSGAFSVLNATIVNTYSIENGKILVEFFSYPNQPIATTGKGTEEVPTVDSYRIKSYQRALLTRQ